MILFVFAKFVQVSKAQSLTVSANKRYLIKDGKPFVWVGDTACEAFRSLNLENAAFGKV